MGTRFIVIECIRARDATQVLLAEHHEVVNALSEAELKGRSLEQELRDVLTNAAPLTPGEKIALFKKLRAMTPPLGDVDVRAAIRHGRDDEFDE
jgi:plasmid stability protein